MQEALIRALATWPASPPDDPKGWLTTVAWRKFLDATRAETPRQARETRAEPSRHPAPPRRRTTRCSSTSCAHPSLTPASAVALTLRAVGGLTTRQIAVAYLVPEATMAQRISRAKRTVSGVRLDRPGDLATVLRVLYLVFNEGYSGEVDLAEEAIRLTRRVASLTSDEEASGLLALMLLHRARRAAPYHPRKCSRPRWPRWSRWAAPCPATPRRRPTCASGPATCLWPLAVRGRGPRGHQSCRTRLPHRRPGPGGSLPRWRIWKRSGRPRRRPRRRSGSSG